ncbi:class I SAM-dependent methyltransferase [Psychromarinibacter sp. C21-152]|uniref:Class I SAM-dependent methyltransferase n=1 Tax=Psychromarinibacter sediminicola TaxID=3033385 RepID=A0AAE3NR41_9RHOB|nr:class I SAM-dependent methyltransferase [Psychromarinibacter sediminicola]MDF0600506.1 class I SAM-dependent methyltransferase [Psychromarinibacter sediminicola]
MNRFEAALRMADGPAIRSLDFSMFGESDIANVALQRSEVLHDIRGQADAIRAWARGDDAPLLRIARQHRQALVARAVAFVFLEYRALRGLLQTLRPARIADIGCGYGFFDLFAQAEFGAELVLIDSETAGARAVKYSETGSGTANLETARRFLVANGCAPARIETLNPTRQNLSQVRDIDLAVSLLSCGFAFSCAPYRSFLRMAVRPGGSVILDLRLRRIREIAQPLTGLGPLRRVGTAADGKAARMHLVTAATAARAA